MSYTPSSVKDEPSTDSTNSIGGLSTIFCFSFYAKPGVFQHHQLLNGMKEGRNQITDQQFIPGIYQISATKFVQSLQTTTFDPSHCSAVRVVTIYSLLLERIGYGYSTFLFNCPLTISITNRLGAKMKRTPSNGLSIPTSIQLTRADSYNRHRVEAKQ